MAKKAATGDWDDETYYDVKLLRPAEYPKGMTPPNILPVGAQIKMKGRALKQIAEDVASAEPVAKSG